MDVVRIDNVHNDFILLTNKLYVELNDRYGLQQSGYDKHNVIETINTAIIGYIDKKPVACGCFKEINHHTIEIKRMYVHNNYRRKGFSVIILRSLEQWGSELGFKRLILETGKGQPEAIGLYKKQGYGVIDNYGPYVNLENSICMEKYFN